MYMTLKKALVVNVDNMGNLHVRLMFYIGKKSKIYHHSSKEHLKICMSAKF